MGRFLISDSDMRRIIALWLFLIGVTVMDVAFGSLAAASLQSRIVGYVVMLVPLSFLAILTKLDPYLNVNPRVVIGSFWIAAMGLGVAGAAYAYWHLLIMLKVGGYLGLTASVFAAGFMLLGPNAEASSPATQPGGSGLATRDASEVFPTAPPIEGWVVIAWVCGVVNGLIISLLTYGMIMKGVAPVRAAYLALLTTLVAINFVLFVRSMGRDDRLSIESHWGGLGGGLGGWRISSSVTFLFTTSALVALLVVAVGSDSPRPNLLEAYRPAMIFAAQKGIRFDKHAVEGGKLVLTGSAPSNQADAEAACNDFWNQVKLVNPLLDDIVVDIKNCPGSPSGRNSTTKL